MGYGPACGGGETGSPRWGDHENGWRVDLLRRIDIIVEMVVVIDNRLHLRRELSPFERLRLWLKGLFFSISPEHAVGWIDGWSQSE